MPILDDAPDCVDYGHSASSDACTKLQKDIVPLPYQKESKQNILRPDVSLHPPLQWSYAPIFLVGSKKVGP